MTQGWVERAALSVLPGGASSLDERLTGRELEVVGLVVSGATNQEIADALGISERTARAHVEAARRKLGARSRTQLAVFAIRRRLVLLDLAS